MRGKPPKPEKVTELESHMSNCIDIIENVWLKDKPFLTGNMISVADIFCACELEQPRKLHESFDCRQYTSCVYDLSNKEFFSCRNGRL